MASFKKKLNKKDLEHFKEMSDSGTTTIKNLKAALQHQKSTGMRCFACEDIARKLGIEV